MNLLAAVLAGALALAQVGAAVAAQAQTAPPARPPVPPGSPLYEGQGFAPPPQAGEGFEAAPLPDQPEGFVALPGQDGSMPEIGAAAGAVPGRGALVRALDKVAGSVIDLEIPTGGSALAFNRMTVTLSDCRYPADNPAGEAYAHLSVHDALASGGPVFSGWMIASSPALNALDHARYDIWLLRCTTS